MRRAQQARKLPLEVVDCFVAGSVGDPADADLSEECQTIRSRLAVVERTPIQGCGTLSAIASKYDCAAGRFLSRSRYAASPG